MNHSLRDSNIELCRIVAILLVITVHGSFYTLGTPTKLSDCHVLSLYIQSFSIIGVNLFVLITGFFSTTPKRSSFYNIAFICLFYACIKIAYDLYSTGFCERTYYTLFFLSYSNWFVIAYLGLYLLSPVLNKYVEAADKRELCTLLICLFVFQSWFGFYPAYPLYSQGNNYCWGYSTISFVNIYLLARYFKLYGFPKFFSMKYDLINYAVISLIIGSIALFLLHTGHASGRRMVQLYAYNNPLIILSSTFVFHFFSEVKLGRVRMINHIAQSSLGILLFHLSRPMERYMRTAFADAYNGGSLFCILLVAFVIYGIALSVDQARIVLYRRICQILCKV